MSQPGDKLPRTPENLELLLRRHHRLLVDAGKQFDSGSEAMAYALALSIRTLVHDRGHGKSLLTQLGIQSTLRFVDTAEHLDGRNLRANYGLVRNVARPGQGLRWEAPLDNLSPPRVHPPLPFDQWWTTPVANDLRGNAWNRYHLVVRSIANMEAGHADPLRFEDLRRWEEENSMGIVFSDGLSGAQAPANGPHLPSVRQVAHELQRTLEAGVGALLG